VCNHKIFIYLKPLSRNQWNCDRVWYIVKYSADRTQTQGFKNFTSYDSSANFDSQPNTRWIFQIQAVNPAGSSPWSPEVPGQTESGGTNILILFQKKYIIANVFNIIQAPGQIRDLRISPLGPETLQLTWQPPVDSYNQITGYDITVTLLSKYNWEIDLVQAIFSNNIGFQGVMQRATRPRDGFCQSGPELCTQAPVSTFSVRNFCPSKVYSAWPSTNQRSYDTRWWYT